MLNRNIKNRSRWTSPAILATAALASFAMAQNSTAQSIGDAVRGAVNGTANANQAGTAATQTPAQRGVNQAVQGVLNGQSVGDAARNGMSEAVRSATGTNQQTQLGNQNLNTQTGVNANLNTNTNANTNANANTNINNGLNANTSAQGSVNWQTDSQGRQFYRDSTGRTIYSGQSQTSANGNTQTQNGANANSNLNGQSLDNHNSTHQAMKEEVKTLRDDVDRLEKELKRVLTRLEME